MLTKKIALAALAGTALLAAAPAIAHQPHWAPAHGWRAKHHQPQHYYHHYRAPAYVYYQAQPVYVPPPVLYYPPPRPVIFGSIPIGDSRVRIAVHF